ncbi:GAP family protein [Nocardia sp. NBC_01327]|uniref:GAP family protein n=1 Tax=Nocardia sp. NBC_01327 TaxID=2903593 RepID=UPI002E126FAF|nr:GAP family protein [Nocardia sp. NBC_01327]
MGHAVGQFLSHAVGVAISPLALIAVILIVSAPRGRQNALAFVLGWVLAITAIFTVLLVISAGAGAEHNGQPASWVAWFRLILGVLIALMALQQLRLSRTTDPDSLPPRLQRVREFTTRNCLILGAVLVVANPKNVMQVAAGAVTTASSTAHLGGRIGAAAIFIAIASLVVLIPLAVHFFNHTTGAGTLERWKTWTVRNQYVIMAVLLALLSAKSLGDGISGLAS